MARLLQDAVAKMQRDEAQRYFSEWQADIRARLLLVDLAESLYEGPCISEENAAVASLMHASDYLADRIGYEMEPHPKNMIRFPSEVADA